MNRLLSGKKLLIVGVVVFLIFIIGLFFLYNNLQSDGEGRLDRGSSIQITSLSPEPSQVLIAGQTQQFEIIFSEEVSPEQVQISLESFDPLQSSSPEPVAIQTEPFQEGFGVRVTTQGVTETYRVYLLDVVDVRRAENIGSFAYESTLQSVETVPENNLELAQFLPHETESYRLVYVENLNTYIFNFKLDPVSSLSANEQFEQARAEAEAFIQSNGVSLDSIVIEWRRS